MPSKRAFTKRLAALAATGLGVGGPIDSLTATQSSDATPATESTPTGTAAPDDEAASGRAVTGADGARSAVAAGEYDPTATASGAVDTVVAGRMDPAVLAETGLPSGFGGRLRRLLGRYQSASLGGLRRATGGAALTASGLEGCGVAVGEVNASGLVAELDADPNVRREADDGSGFTRFRARSVGSAVAVAPGELVAAYASTPAAAAEHRDAGVGHDRRRAGTSGSYGPLPALLDGDAAVFVDLGPDGRGRLRRALADAPDGLRTAVDASSAVGASLTLTEGEAADGPESADDAGGGPGRPSVALRYGAVADPRRLDVETVDAVARAAREGENSLSEATVSRSGRTVIVDAAAEGDLFASHASLFGASVGDRIEVTDA